MLPAMQFLSIQAQDFIEDAKMHVAAQAFEAISEHSSSGLH